MAAADIVTLISWKELPGAVNFVDHWYLLDKNVCLYNSETCGLRCTESNWYFHSGIDMSDFSEELIRPTTEDEQGEPRVRSGSGMCFPWLQKHIESIGK